MKVKIIVSACICALGLALAILGYIRMQSVSGPAQSVAPGTVDTAMLLIGAGACLALLGAVLTVFAAIRSRA